MFSYDERLLVVALDALQRPERIAFAAAAATRQLSNFERYARESGLANQQRPRQIAEQLWSEILLPYFDREKWIALLTEVMSLLPDRAESKWLDHALAEDADSSLAYAIRCLLRFPISGSSLGWAACF